MMRNKEPEKRNTPKLAVYDAVQEEAYKCSIALMELLMRQADRDGALKTIPPNRASEATQVGMIRGILYAASCFYNDQRGAKELIQLVLETTKMGKDIGRVERWLSFICSVETEGEGYLQNLHNIVKDDDPTTPSIFRRGIAEAKKS